MSRPLFSWLQLRPFLSATFHRHIKLLPLLILVAAEEKSHPSRGRRCQHIRSKKTSEVLRRSGHVRVCCVSYKNNQLSRRGSCPAATDVCVRSQIWKSEGHVFNLWPLPAFRMPSSCVPAFSHNSFQPLRWCSGDRPLSVTTLTWHTVYLPLPPWWCLISYHVMLALTYSIPNLGSPPTPPSCMWK